MDDGARLPIPPARRQLQLQQDNPRRFPPARAMAPPALFNIRDMVPVLKICRSANGSETYERVLQVSDGLRLRFAT
jgi:hypothetical protein